MTSQQKGDLLLAEYREAKFRLIRCAILVEHGKHIDDSEFERELQVIRDCMERTS